ncbi:MAG: hypothetical protein ACKKMS_02530 [Candidatus Nealsonbacteria bacterium]
MVKELDKRRLELLNSLNEYFLNNKGELKVLINFLDESATGWRDTPSPLLETLVALAKGLELK